MSTLKVENIQHPDAESPALVLAADGSVEIIGGGGLGGEEYLFVAATGDAAANGAELAAAYALAKTMTPYGQPLSATNRVTILVAPGEYDFGTNTVWEIDADFVNVLSLDGARSIRIVSAGPEIETEFNTFPGEGVDVTADYAHLRGIDVGDNRFAGCSGPDLLGADNLLVENCAGGFASFGWFGTLSGVFVGCTGGGESFGYAGTASGVFKNCLGGNASFGRFSSGTFIDCVAEGFGNSFGDVSASGIFTNCTAAGNFSFGSFMEASGTFTNCTAAGDYAFGGFDKASGTFTDCTGGEASFGYAGTASGTFTNCTGGDDSFGGFGTLSGFVLYCRLTDGTFPTPDTGGLIRLSIDGDFNEVNAG